MSPCLEENEIVDFVTGNLSSAEAMEAEAHIDQCPSCRVVLIELARVFELRASSLPEPRHDSTERSEDVPLPFALRPPALMRGASIGRYVVLDVLGAGAMGVVYAAYDPELDRRVALKLLRERSGDGNGRERLIREARATARLAHPNVIVVHDVGQHDADVFMAMEYVDGGTLGEWLSAQTRPRTRVVEAFLEAARGLLAAHDAGLVHRDFKPANVLVGSDERIRVTDFGLARPGGQRLLDEASMVTLPDVARPLEHSLTRTGAVVGTPAYMSPEQFAGQVADARSDQFSFCVALFEALCGERPFEGRSFAELAAAVSMGKRRTLSAFSELPRGLRQALDRGLQAEPSARFPDMRALIRALERGEQRRMSSSTRGVFWGSLVVGLGAVAVSLSTSEEPPDPCAPLLDRWGELWDAPRRDALAAQMIGSGRPYAEDTASRVTARLDALSDSWEQAYTRSCYDSTSSAQTLCLQRRVVEFETVVAALEAGGGEVVEHATRAVQRLRPAASCSGELLEMVTEPPEPPAEIQERVEELRRSIATADALHETRQYAASLEEATWARERAEELAYAPLQAEAMLAEGRVRVSMDELEVATDVLRESATTAWSAGHDRVALDAATELVLVVGAARGQADAARVWAEFGRASLERLGGSKEVEANLDEALGALAHQERKWGEAREHLTRARTRREQALGTEHPKVLSTLSRLVAVDLERGEFAAGLETAQQLLQAQTRTLGTEHPAVMRTMGHIGTALTQLGRLDEAAEELERALQLGLRVLGPSHPQLSDIRHNLASVATRQGRHAEAEALYLLLIENRAKQLEGPDPMLGTLYHNLGNVVFRQGRNAEATEYLEKAIAAKSAGGEDSPSVAGTLSTLVAVAVAAKRCERAVEYGARALNIAENHAEATAGSRVYALGTLADALRCAGRLEDARQRARQAVELAHADENLVTMRSPVSSILADIELDRGDRAAAEKAALEALQSAQSPAWKATAKYQIARAIVDERRDEALALARAALELLGERPADDEERLTIEAFLQRPG